MSDDHHFDTDNIPTIDNVKWKPDSSASDCRLCEKKFDAFRRKHHCRACGDIFCNACSDEKANIIGYRESQRVCKKCYRRLSTGFHEIKQVNESEAKDDEFLLSIRELPGNDRCVDCGDPEPTWASLSLGTLLCLKCAGIHREFGVTVSFVQSLTLDTIQEDKQEILRQGGNAIFHVEVLGRLPHDLVSQDTRGSDNASDWPYTYNASIDKMYRVYHSRVAELYRRRLKARISGDEEPMEVEESYQELMSSPRSSPQAAGSPRTWANDTEHCMHCQEKFSVARRRHHCRMCGLCLCDDCAPADNTRPVLINGKMTEARVCLKCFNPPSRAASVKSKSSGIGSTPGGSPAPATSGSGSNSP